MARQGNGPQRGWYDEIMRGQYYDEIIPAYEALQEQMIADSSSLFTICLSLLFTTLRALMRCAVRLPAAHLPPTQGISGTRDATETIVLKSAEALK
jgi:hypothetical protein